MNSRKAFPCFDEPAMKAKFTVHISRDPTHQSLSNLQRDYEERKGIALMVDHYVTSPPMSTYLLGFMVLDFKYQETTTASGVKVRVSSSEPVAQRSVKLTLGLSKSKGNFPETCLIFLLSWKYFAY